MEDPDSGYTIDQHLAPTGAAAHELASAKPACLQFLSVLTPLRPSLRPWRAGWFLVEPQ